MIAEKREYAISDLIANIARTKRRRTKSFGTQSRFFLGTGQIDDDQEGFLNGRSTSRYLFRLLANLNEVKRKNMACLILFIDFSKAFDRV